jgi:hypothetical protein
MYIYIYIYFVITCFSLTIYSYNKTAKYAKDPLFWILTLFFLLWCCFIFSYLLDVFFIGVFCSLLLSVEVMWVTQPTVIDPTVRSGTMKKQQEIE